MSGTFSIAYTQQFDAITGGFLSGGLLYVYAADTSTPSSVYEDSSLTLSQSNPVELDSAGRIPAVWVADGNYRLVLRNADGITQFDITSTPAIGASTSGTSSSSGTSVNADSLLKTGYPLWLPVSGTLTGFVRMNGRTISSGSGAGTERANADVQDLFLYIWTNFSDTDCPVGGGRGATAAADYAANKAIATLDMRGRAPYGLDDMGNSAASIITAATAAAGALGTQTIGQTHLPSVNFTVSGTAASHAHTITVTNGATLTQGSNTSIQEGGGTTHTNMREGVSTQTVTASAGASGTLALTATAASGGSGTAKVSPGRAGSWYWKL